jgi:hypothetical protein
MRVSAILVLSGLVTLAGCSRNDRDYEQPTRTESMDVREEPASAPGVDVTAAPGVAFNYRYAFRLPGNRISAVQEAHAQACEKLGLDECRITGMRYRLVNQKDIQAMLVLRLDPAIARGFGKNATEIVSKADGMLVDQEISGEDVGSRIKSATRSEADLRSDLAAIEAQLTTMRANDPHRGELVARADELRTQIRSLGRTRTEGEEALAGTPMVFNYGSGSVIPGFDVRSPIREAFQDAGDNLVNGFAIILVILITLIPWAFLVALLAWGFRYARRRWGWFASVRDGYAAGPVAPEPPPAPPARKSRRSAGSA